MSLTDDWKARKLKTGGYYVRLSNGRVDIAKLSKYNNFYAISYTFEVKEVLAPCDYDYISELESKNKHLLDLQANQDKEVEKLRELLWECKEKIHNEFINQEIVSIDNFYELLTRIGEVLKC